MLTSVDAVIDELGGTGAAAEIAGVRPSAVSNWRAKGLIPPEYFVTVSDALIARGLQAERAVFGFKVPV